MIGEVGGDGWVRVRWDAGTVNSYRMGREDRYDIALAPSELEQKAGEGERRDEPEDANLSVGESERERELQPLLVCMTHLLSC